MVSIPYVHRTFWLLAITVFLAPGATHAQDSMSPDDWLIRANEQFQSGDNEGAKISALKVLDIGQKRSNPDWIGGALTILCRTALADGNADTLGKYTAELQALTDATGDQRWLTTIAEMNAALGAM